MPFGRSVVVSRDQLWLRPETESETSQTKAKTESKWLSFLSVFLPIMQCLQWAGGGAYGVLGGGTCAVAVMGWCTGLRSEMGHNTHRHHHRHSQERLYILRR